MAKYKYITDFTFEGKRYKVRAHTSEELAVKKALKIKELQEGFVRESELLLKDWLLYWFETFKEPYIAANTKIMYRAAIKNINSYIGHRKLKQVTSSDIQSIITSEYKNGFSKSRIDKIYLTLSQAFERAEVDGKIKKSPVKGIMKPKMDEGKRRAITDEERKAILEVAKTHRHGRWIRAMLYLGLRPDETSLIQGKDIDFERRELHVRGRKSLAANRYIPIPDRIIDDYSGFSNEEYVFATERGNSPNRDRIRDWWTSFRNDVDIHMGAKVYRNQIIKSVLADDLVLYCLRHTYGTDCAAAGVPVLILAKLMGHKDIRTTHKYYIDESKEGRDLARDMLDTLYAKKGDI